MWRHYLTREVTHRLNHRDTSTSKPGCQGWEEVQWGEYIQHGPGGVILWHVKLENKHLCHIFASHQGLSSPMLRCPSQRLLDRIVRRYAEVPDAGSIYMDHLTDRDKLRLLYTLSVNSHPILLQVHATLTVLKHHPATPCKWTIVWDVLQAPAAEKCQSWPLASFLTFIKHVSSMGLDGWSQADSCGAHCITQWSSGEMWMSNPLNKSEPRQVVALAHCESQGFTCPWHFKVLCLHC